MAELFSDARRKIKRTDQHIYHLNEVLDSFLKSDFYNLDVKKDPDTGQHFLEYSVDPMLEDIPLILGDALHNLRTSLDFVATGIATIANRPVRYSKFPIRETREEVIAAINGVLKQAAPASVISAILDEIKPYKGGNDALCALHALDIRDKHLLIVPTISITTVTNVDLTFGSMRMHNCTLIVEAGRKIGLAGGPPGGPDLDLQIQSKGQPTCEVIFSKECDVFWKQPVIPTLHRLSQLVSVCVDAIAKAYPPASN